MKPRLTIIIVTWRAASAALRALRSLRAARGVDSILAYSEIIVVDNASGDGTPERLAREFPEILVVNRSCNGGFGVGVNEGIRRARGEYVFLMNPDCELLPDREGRSLIGALAKHLYDHPRVAAVGPSLMNRYGHLDSRGRQFPSPLLELRRNLGARWPRQWRYREEDRGELAVDWISGACMLLRRAAIDEIGAFDESFFLYWEETDWCRRARAASWEIHHRADLSLLHLGGASAEAAGGPLEKGCLADHFRRSRRRYFSKHHGALQGLAVEALHALIRLRRRRARGHGRMGVWR
jgi:N-acetylglucosaminyl-diphospho-decaprenol L-rhamnosyltransferase